MYDHQAAAKKWSAAWREHRVYEPNVEQPQKPFYNLMMFPYPSAEGLHVGNMYAFSGADIYGRYQRMRGHDVFEPIGLDGFGIHSENYALKIGKHPAEQAKVSEANFYRQLQMIGNSFAWEERLETYDPEYYKWTQWLFIQMFKHGLAYKGTSLVNWCPSCKTVLADEQVEDGKCERCKSEVERKEAEQWFFKITEYADQLLANIEKLRWPDKIRTAQRQWIGKAKGLNIHFAVDGLSQPITVWTKFWETIFGTTFLVLAPEYELLSQLPIPEKLRALVDEYVKAAKNKTEQQRQMEAGQKTGVFTGVYARNPVNGEQVQIWVADYVLSGVGTGAVMGVPAHDQRDFEFAQKYKLPIVQVVEYDDEQLNQNIQQHQHAVEPHGKLVHSAQFDGQDAQGAGKQNIAEWMIQQKTGEWLTTYHLRDWLISRQRYWGPPIPMVHCEDCGWQPVPESELPVLLPMVEEYKPTGDGMAPLERAGDDWLWTKCPACGKKARRETDVSDTFLDSSWYFLRYPTLAGNKKRQQAAAFDPAITQTWLPVNAYIGGAEHAVLHLLYSRFVTMALKDWGYLSFEEPFPFLFGHGLIIKDGSKMSKSKGNVVNPDEYIEKFGADALRTYLMFLGPYDQGGDFRDSGIAAMAKWLHRVWRLLEEKEQVKQTTSRVRSKLHWTIEKCTREMEEFKFNTAIAALMECVNVWQEEGESFSAQDTANFLCLLAPFAPYFTEEAYHRFVQPEVGEDVSIHRLPWPAFDASVFATDTTTIVVQVNGKTRGTLVLPKSEASQEAQLVAQAETLTRVASQLKTGSVKRTVIVPSRLVNFVLD